MKKLIAIDMDGTLFNSSGKISEGNLMAIREAQEAGHIVMLCSGRPHDVLLDFMKDEYDVVLPVAGSNGSCSYTEGQTIHSVSMDKTLAGQLFQMLLEDNHPFRVYTNQGVFTIDGFLDRFRNDLSQCGEEDAGGLTVERYAEYLKSSKSVDIGRFEDISLKEGLEIYKFFVSTLIPEKKSHLENRLNSFEGPFGFTSSAHNNVEIMSEQGHKGTGLSEMARYYNIPMKDTIAIGDNFNDIPMLEAAGLSIAMGNAEPQIKELCHRVTRTNDEDGVAYAIRQYVLNG